MINKIVDSYFKLRKALIEDHVIEFNCIILISPFAFSKLLDELAKQNDLYMINDREKECRFIYIAGQKVPLIIERDMGENVELMIMTQKDYERIEQEKFLNNMYKIFGN